ncbi:MAG: FHA domain-containing protein [Prevotella sp.]|nr:FHA domain-containing protein [Prevotella sp.]
MEQFIQIKCPFCGAVLKVRQQAGLEKASITCPVCKRKSLFCDYVNKNSEETELPESFKSAQNSEETEIVGAVNMTIGCLVEKSGQRWPLHSGVNTIGRKLQSDSQQVEIAISDYTGERKMSRSHAKIEVIRQANGSCKHVLYNWQNRNRTCVGGEPLETGDRIVLHSGMVIKFANVDVTFVIEDPEATTI